MPVGGRLNLGVVLGTNLFETSLAWSSSWLGLLERTLKVFKVRG